MRRVLGVNSTGSSQKQIGPQCLRSELPPAMRRTTANGALPQNSAFNKEALPSSSTPLLMMPAF